MIVGVNTDELIQKYKNKTPVIPCEERMEIIKAVKYVDRVIPKPDLEKVQFAIDNKVNIMFIGSDWKGNERWANDEKELNKHGIELMYLPHTSHLSTTKLISKIQKN